MIDGRIGLLRLKGETWSRLTGENRQSVGEPAAAWWMEAIALADGDVLVYPNDRSSQAEAVVYAPARRRGRAAALLLRFVLAMDEPSAENGGHLEMDPCTPLIEGELREREVVCVETGCRANCTRSFFRKSGVEIIECGCPE
jgi:hypothetical protein